MQKGWQHITLKDLIGKSLVSVGKRSFDGKIKTCLIHDLLRQSCLREAQKENFMHVLEADASPQGLDKLCHLIFNLDNCADMQILPPLPHLQSFIWLSLGSHFTSGMVILQLSGCKLPRVLDMYFLHLDTFLEQLLNLVNLRYLALNVSYELDDRISLLKKLETLMIYGPWIPHPTLFLEFWKMPCLRHVNVTVPSSLSPLPPVDLEVPSNLQTLFTVTFSSCTKEVFYLTPHLEKLGVFETEEEYENGDQSSECFKNLSFLTKLEILKCSFYKGNGYARSLSLDVIPISLKKLSLSGSCLSWDEMKFLAGLPKLEILKLKNHAFQGPKWVLTEEVFPLLKRLLIDNTDLVDWEAASTDHFPCLERLVLRSCKSLENIPCGIAELSVIELIELHYCSQSAENSARKYEEQDGGLKVVIRSDN